MCSATLHAMCGIMDKFSVIPTLSVNGLVKRQSEPESMEWVSQYADANMVKTDFFEARSTAYAKSTALIDDL